MLAACPGHFRLEILNSDCICPPGSIELDPFPFSCFSFLQRKEKRNYLYKCDSHAAQSPKVTNPIDLLLRHPLPNPLLKPTHGHHPNLRMDQNPLPNDSILPSQSPRQMSQSLHHKKTRPNRLSRRRRR